MVVLHLNYNKAYKFICTKEIFFILLTKLKLNISIHTIKK